MKIALKCSSVALISCLIASGIGCTTIVEDGEEERSAQEKANCFWLQIALQTCKRIGWGCDFQDIDTVLSVEYSKDLDCLRDETCEADLVAKINSQEWSPKKTTTTTFNLPIGTFPDSEENLTLALSTKPIPEDETKTEAKATTYPSTYEMVGTDYSLQGLLKNEVNNQMVVNIKKVPLIGESLASAFTQLLGSADTLKRSFEPKELRDAATAQSWWGSCAITIPVKVKCDVSDLCGLELSKPSSNSFLAGLDDAIYDKVIKYYDDNCSQYSFTSCKFTISR
jgi:hypothetical protein